MTGKELYVLTHPEQWPHKFALPVIRKDGDPIRDKKDAGIVMDDDFCRVWTGVYFGDGDPMEGNPLDYSSPEALLKEWEID